MRKFVLVIAEQIEGGWSVWFANYPQTKFGGKMPAEGLIRLLEHCGFDQFDTDGVVPIENATRDGHLEFMIPLRHNRFIPFPSAN